MLCTMRHTRTTAAAAALTCAALLTACGGGSSPKPTTGAPTPPATSKTGPPVGDVAFAVAPMAPFSPNGTWGLDQATGSAWVADRESLPVVDGTGRVWAIVHPASGGSATHLLVVDPGTGKYAVSGVVPDGDLAAPGGTPVLATSSNLTFSANVLTAQLGTKTTPGTVTLAPAVDLTVPEAGDTAPVLRVAPLVYVATNTDLHTFNPDSRAWVTSAPTHKGRVLGVIPATTGGVQVEWVGATTLGSPTSVWVGNKRIPALDAKISGKPDPIAGPNPSTGCFVTMLGATPAHAMLGQSCYDADTQKYEQAKIVTVTPGGQTHTWTPAEQGTFTAGAPSPYQFGSEVDPWAPAGTAIVGGTRESSDVVTTSTGMMVASPTRISQHQEATATVIADNGGALHAVTNPPAQSDDNADPDRIRYTTSIGQTVFGQVGNTYVGDGTEANGYTAGVALTGPAGPASMNSKAQPPVASTTANGRTYGVFYDPNGVDRVNLIVTPTKT